VHTAPSLSKSLLPAAALALGLFALSNLAVVPPSAAQPGSYFTEQLDPVFYDLPENLEIRRLENGLRVVLMRNPAQPMIGVFTQVEVGSAYEDFRTSGMSHMLEHLLFNGTELWTQQELYDLADLAGAYNNAHTTDFYTNYLLVAPAGELETALQIQSQMLFHSVIPPEKFAKEKGIVVGEIVSGRDSPSHFTEEALRRALYDGSSLALPTLGTKSTIDHMQRDDVYEFYKRWYVPNNMVLTLAGNFDRDRALTLLESFYGSVAPGTLPDVDLLPVAPRERTTTVVRRGGDTRVLSLAFDAPGYGSPDFFPFQVMTSLLDAPGSGILTRAVGDLDPQQPQHGADVAVWWEKADGFSRLILEFELAEQTDPTRCYRLVQEAVAAALEFGVTSDDVNEIVRMRETETLLEWEQLRMTGIYIAEPLVEGGVDFFASYLPRLREVSSEDVARVLESYLLDIPCLAVLIEPTPPSAGSTPGAEGMQIPGMPEGMEVPPAMLEAMRQAGMSGGPEGATDPDDPADPGAPPPGGQAAAAANVPTLPVDRTVLENGAILLSQTNPASPLMAIHLAVRNRALLDRELAAPGALNLVHSLLSKGIGGCDEACLARRLRSLGTVIKLVDDPRFPMDNYYTNGRFSFIRIETTAANGPEVLRLLADMTQHAIFTGDDFETARQAQLERAERQHGSARATANTLLDETLYGDHPLVQDPEGDVDSLDGVSYDQARTVYRRAFSPQNLILSVVSPQSHESLVELCEEILPGRGRPTEGLPALPVTSAPERRTGTVGGEMAAIRLGSIFAVAPEDEKALEILVAILSDRLAMDLRETRGLSYSVGASISHIGDEAEFVAWLNPPRERIAEGELALSEFVAGFDAASITDEELARIRSARKGRQMMRRLSSLSQAYYLAMAELDGDVGAYLGALSGYDALTVADLRRVGARYLEQMAMVTVVVD